MTTSILEIMEIIQERQNKLPPEKRHWGCRWVFDEETDTVKHICVIENKTFTEDLTPENEQT